MGTDADITGYTPIGEIEDMGGIKLRIVGSGFEDPEQLLANPMNFRIHPIEQRELLEGVFDEVGWLQRVLVNKNTGNMLDGHLRVSIALSRGEKRVPVEYVDLTEDEEKVALAVFDKITAMAVIDGKKYAELMDSIMDTVEVVTPALRAGLEEIALELGSVKVGSVGDDDEFDDDFIETDEFVEFRIGNYKGKISKDIYESFQECYREVRQLNPNAVMLNDVLERWLAFASFADEIEGAKVEMVAEFDE